MGTISRRNFLKGAGIGALGVAGAGALFACSPQNSSGGEKEAGNSDAGSASASGSWRTAPDPIAESDIVETYDCDVLVIGLGHAGSCAMRAAAEAGAKVCAMQETAEDSLTFRGGGQIGHINSNFLKERGVPEVDLVEFMNDWQVRSNNRSNPGLIMNYAKNAGVCFDWLFEDLTDEQKAGIKINCLVEGGPYKKELSGVKTWVGTAFTSEYITDALKKCIQVGVDAGGKVYYETKACQLVTDESGAVTGAIGKGPDGYVQVNAAKGVIIATGGFGSNSEMCNDLLYEIKETMSAEDEISCMLDADGSGIQLGYWAGGRLDPCMGTMDGAYWYPTDGPTDPLGATAALWINAEGNRYSNEGFGSTELQAMPGARQPSGIISTVFDSNVEDLVRAQPFGHMCLDYSTGDFTSLHETMDKAYAGGANGSADPNEDGDKGGGAGTDKAQMAAATMFAADDFETLGTYLGYEGDALKNFVASIERYNELCEKGVDEDFGKDPSLLFPLKNPPYYGYCGTKAIGVLMVTVGGLLIDANGAVLGDDYRPIKGLYAAGNASGGRFGWQYFTSIAGQSLSIAETLGMLAGQNAAQA